MTRTWQAADGLKSAPAPVVAVNERNRAWTEAAAARDLDGMMAIYAIDAQELLPDMEPLVGRDQIRSFYAQLIADLPRFSHSFSPKTATVADSEDLVVMRGVYQFHPDAREPAQSQAGKYVGVWRSVNGIWELFLNISNGDGK